MWNIPRVTCIFWHTREYLGECVYQENASDECDIPRVTCIFWYTREYLGKCVYRENVNDEWDIPQLYHEKVLNNYFMPCHRKYSARREGWVWYSWIALIDGKVTWNTDEHTTTEAREQLIDWVPEKDWATSETPAICSNC